MRKARGKLQEISIGRKKHHFFSRFPGVIRSSFRQKLYENESEDYVRMDTVVF